MDFRKILISNNMKIRSVGAELFDADRERERRSTDGQTDMTKLIVTSAILRKRLKMASGSSLPPLP